MSEFTSIENASFRLQEETDLHPDTVMLAKLLMQKLDADIGFDSSWDRPNTVYSALEDLELSGMGSWDLQQVFFIWSLAEHMSCFDFVPHGGFQYFYHQFGLPSSDLDLGKIARAVMKDCDREFYDSLPETFRVYRGQEASIDLGCSWTTDLKTAREFSIRGSRPGRRNENPAIHYADIKKSDVLVALNDREEFEIVWMMPRSDGLVTAPVPEAA
ncbi:hypothetical protein [Roseibium alexandrii]|uniref:Uncharacterized protein n=1 Tax=Roseibium alexandrii (strain DSM 17067 / NCIMB 14079 / DFL-11) TaxID=244592 RepID=A0A5E8GYQ1_ROSAD|nr:hypothetical protein [Roseibium alexandrii]EEE45023.1 hypothetical protein SADFL11_2311 [Roseibium alexandrii DFL-11]